MSNRQRRLDLLSAVPLDRREWKDFEAAFGDNPDDVPWLMFASCGTLTGGGSLKDNCRLWIN